MLIDKLKSNPSNPRTIGKKEFAQLKKKIKNFPAMLEKRPIVYDKDFIVLGGNQRLRVLKELIKEGFEVKDSYFKSAKDWTKKQKREFVILDNIADGDWDYDLLANEWSDLPLEEWGIDTGGWGEEVEEDEPPPLPEGKPDSKLGEVYKLGKHKLMCGDATKKGDVKELMDGKKAEIIFTSPPYNMGGKMYENYDDDLKSQEYIDFNLKTINAWIKHFNGYLFWNISYNKNARWEFLEIMYRIIKETGLRFMEMIVWDKGHALPITSKDMLTRQYEDILLVGKDEAMGKDMELFYLGSKYKRAWMNKGRGKGISNYWRINVNKVQLKNHLACFPVGLPHKGIRLTTRENDGVIDMFGGSGSTLIACEQTNRTCYMMELDPKYCDVIRKRYANFIGRGDQWQKITPKI